MYSPKIKPELVKRLYRLKLSKSRRKPLTKYVNEAIELYLAQNENNSAEAPGQREGWKKDKAE
jgi:predicted DNA-binding protein